MFSRVLKQQWRELVEASAPSLPFVRRARRFVIDMFDASFLQRLMEVATAARQSSFGVADADEKHLDLPGESLRVTQQFVKSAGNLRKTERRAEGSDVGKFIEMRLCDFQSLRAAERNSGNGAVLAARDRAIG